MKRKAIATAMIIGILASSPAPVAAAVEGVTSENWMEYQKPIKDAYGFNKGECDRPYLDGEEYFYSEYYDHWNVDKVYDKDEAKERRSKHEEENGKKSRSKAEELPKSIR